MKPPHEPSNPSAGHGICLPGASHEWIRLRAPVAPFRECWEPPDAVHGQACVSCGSFAAQAGEVAVRGAAYGGGSVVDNHASPPAAVDSVELEAFHAAGDVLDGGRVQGDEVGIAPHEADPAAVLDHGDGVSGQQGEPRPWDPAGQCSMAAPSKWPPMRATLTPGTGSMRSSKYSMRGGGRCTHSRSAFGISTRASKASAISTWAP